MTTRGWLDLGARDPSAGYDQDRLSEALVRFFCFSSSTATERRAEKLRGDWEAARDAEAIGRG